MGSGGILFRLKDDVLASAIRSLLTLDYLFFCAKSGDSVELFLFFTVVHSR